MTIKHLITFGATLKSAVGHAERLLAKHQRKDGPPQREECRECAHYEKLAYDAQSQAQMATACFHYLRSHATDAARKGRTAEAQAWLRRCSVALGDKLGPARENLDPVAAQATIEKRITMLRESKAQLVREMSERVQAAELATAKTWFRDCSLALGKDFDLELEEFEDPDDWLTRLGAAIAHLKDENDKLWRLRGQHKRQLLHIADNLDAESVQHAP